MVWEVRKGIIEKLQKMRQDHQDKAMKLTDEKKFEEAANEIHIAIGIGEAIHEVLYSKEKI